MSLHFLRPFPSLFAAVGLLLLLPRSIASGAGLGPPSGPTCTVTQEGDVAMRDASSILKRRSKTVVEEHQTRNLVTGEDMFTVILKRGRRVTLETSLLIRGDQSFDFVRKLGRGFKGIKEIHQTRTGDAIAVTVDGREVSIPALQGSPPSLVFSDGKPAPRFHVKRAVANLVQAANDRLEALSSCTPRSGIAPREFNDPFRDECERCYSGCWGVMFACSAASVGTSEIVGFFDSSLGCGGRLEKCVDLCNAVDHECCHVHCGGSCCGRNADPAETICSGARPDFAGVCCTREGACGDYCCGPGKTCGDPDKKLCCPNGGTGCGNFCCGGTNGSFCADAATSLCCPKGGEGCGFLCCPDGQRCSSPSMDPDLIVCNVCPPGKTGPACGNTCCGADETCNAGVCCRPDSLCGGSCCDPQYCLNGSNCCAPPSHACGGSCCAPLQGCCNGQCCNGPCVVGVCCAPERVCGSTCCPDGWSCTDPANGTCERCGAGQKGCAPVAGNPTCCATGTDCCSSGDCCAPPLVCCDPPFGPPGCYPQASCVN